MRRRATVALVAVLLLACAGASSAQDEILTFSLDPIVLEVSPGQRTTARLTMTNASPYPADEVETSWSGPSGFAFDPAPTVVAVVDPFGSASVALAVRTAPATPLGEAIGSLEIIYSYCIGDLCYQIVESAPVALRVVPAPQTSSSAVGGEPSSGDAGPKAVAILWQWLAFGSLALLVGVAFLVRRGPRVRALVPVLLVAAASVALGLGASLQQHRQAQAVAAVLCTSCVGIETVETAEPRLSAAQAAAVDRLSQRVELIVFYAPWCRSCPYAEAFVEMVARRNPLVGFRLVNAEDERDLAAAHGVTRTGRTVVPAIVRTDTGRVLFGVEDLGDRLVELLEEET